MMQELECVNKVDDNNNPNGGIVTGTGIDIVWQSGPLGTGPKRQAPNGAFVEGVIQAAIQRLEFFQLSKFNCEDNRMCLVHLRAALEYLNQRTDSRKARGVEGTHTK